MRHFKKILQLLLIIGVQSCYSWGGIQPLCFVNNSDMEVSFYPYTFLPISTLYGEFYPDTILKQDSLRQSSLLEIQPHSKLYWETPYNYREIKQGIIPFANDELSKALKHQYKVRLI